MNIQAACECGVRFEVPPHFAGQQVNCPSCGSMVAIPSGPAVNPAASFPSQPMITPTHAPRAKSNTAMYIILGGVIAAMFCCCTPVGFVFLVARNAADSLGGPTLTVQDEDYAVARKQFQTKLIRREASPQDWDPLITPPGAVEVTYQSDGLNLKAFVDPQPADGEKHPAVLFLHGGFAYGDGDWEMPQPYRDAGFVVMMPILRGENGQPGTFTMYFDEVNDVLAAGDALAALPYVDDENVFIAGHSAGGTLTALAAAATDRFRAAASLSGAMNQHVNLDSPELIVFDSSDEREIQIRSPEAYATSFKCPIRLYYGNHEIFLISANKRTGKTASAAGLDAEAVQVPGDHFTSVPPAIEKSIPFFNRHRK